MADAKISGPDTSPSTGIQRGTSSDRSTIQASSVVLFDEPRDDDAPPPTPEAQEAVAREFAERFPHILAIATAATAGDLSRVGQGCDEQFEFEFALDLLLDGFDRLRAEGWTSRDR